MMTSLEDINVDIHKCSVLECDVGLDGLDDSIKLNEIDMEI